jgi:acetolactate synthase regulatory subunit
MKGSEERVESFMKARALPLRHDETLDGKGSRRRVTADMAICVMRMLRRCGFTVKVVGSFATGRFGLLSDVDFPVAGPPSDQIWMTEADAIDIMGSIELDLSYRPEVRERVLQHMEQRMI